MNTLTKGGITLVQSLDLDNGVFDRLRRGSDCESAAWSAGDLVILLVLLAITAAAIYHQAPHEAHVVPDEAHVVPDDAHTSQDSSLELVIRIGASDTAAAAVPPPNESSHQSQAAVVHDRTVPRSKSAEFFEKNSVEKQSANKQQRRNTI